MLDPVAESEHVERQPIAPRLDSLDDSRIGLLNNGKPAATPTLAIIEDRLDEQYDGISFEHYDVDHLNLLKNDDELATIESWAADLDACIAALGDCGSCTKLLVYGVNAVERAGTPAVGVIDEGFEIDYRSNRTDFGRELRYHRLPAIAEVTDEERLREELTDDVVSDVAAALTEPRTDAERAEHPAQDATAGRAHRQTTE